MQWKTTGQFNPGGDTTLSAFHEKTLAALWELWDCRGEEQKQGDPFRGSCNNLGKRKWQWALSGLWVLQQVQYPCSPPLSAVREVQPDIFPALVVPFKKDPQGVPIVAQQKWTQLLSMTMWVWPLASLSRLRIQCGHELWLQMQLWI